MSQKSRVASPVEEHTAVPVTLIVGDRRVSFEVPSRMLETPRGRTDAVRRDTVHELLARQFWDAYRSTQQEPRYSHLDVAH